MLPERSSSSTTSRGRAVAAPAGGTRVSATVPSRTAAEPGVSPRRSRTTKSWLARSPGSSRNRRPFCLGPHRQTRRDVAELEPGRVDVDRRGQRDRIRETGQQHRRRDPRRVRHRIGVPTGAVTDRAGTRWHARDVAGCDHEREAEGGLAVVEGQQPGELDAHRNPLVRGDVADPHGEHARPFLLHDRRALPGVDGLLVVGAGLAAFAQHAVDGAAIGVQGQRGDGGAVG